MSNEENKFLSLQWFKDKTESAIEKVVAKKLDSLIEEEELSSSSPSGKPYMKATLVNDVLTIVLNNGDIISKPNATVDDYHEITQAQTEMDILVIVGHGQIVIDKEQQKQAAKRILAIQKGLKLLENSEEFAIDGTTAYFKDISRSIPQILVEELIEVVYNCNENGEVLSENETFLSLKRFFMWCCLNPRAEVANELYRFLKDNSFRITKQGFFVALRNVVTVGSADTTLVQFISNAYNKVKAVWKKSPDSYRVCEVKGEYILQKTNDKPSGTILGNLTTLYLDLPSMRENRFTDAYTGKFDIRVGKVVNMPMEDCSWSTADCMEAGLHFTSDQIHYVGCGDTSVLVLINPMKVVGIGTHKGRYS